MLKAIKTNTSYKLFLLFVHSIFLLSFSQLLYAYEITNNEISENLSAKFYEKPSAHQLSLDDAWKQLTSKKHKDIELAIDIITKANPPQVYPALSAILEGQLYFNKETQQLFIMQELENSYQFNHLFQLKISASPVIQDNKNGFKKVRTNNKLRSTVRQALASIQLKDTNAKIRLGAVEALLNNPSTDSALLVKSLVASETDAQVLSAMNTLLAIHDIENGDEETQMAAINVLSESLNPSSINALMSYQPENKKLKQKKLGAIKKINNKRDLYSNIETVFFGLSLGSVLALSAIGLAITFGVMGVINMAHGELMMIGAYTTYVVQLLMPDNIGASIIVAIPAAFIVAGLVGIAIERGIIKHLYGRPLETLLATFGISLILQQIVRSIFSPLNRSVETPQWMSDAWQINEVLGLTWNRFYIIIFCLLVFIALILVMKKTVLGLQVRAVSQNRNMARAMGVRSEWVDALTFGLGSGIAGLAGVALSLLTNVGPNLGQAYIIDSFMVVVFGGVGNLWGTLVAGMSLGVINKLLEPWAGAVLAKIILLVFIILFIQKRPKGLFPQRGRAAED